MSKSPERILTRFIEDELGKSYVDYALSVVLARAIPDVRDGLKPVHRRILYAMSELGLGSSRGYRKCATIVGDVLGKYHPHGDQAVYEALVRMAQDFSLRAPLVDGQGNFGSIDGDAPAAYRYTEARLTRAAEDLLRGIEKETVGHRATFDGKGVEPAVLPAAYPQLVINGATGIAVGFATSIPPHAASEVREAIDRLAADPDITDAEMVRPIQGPDFPGGGVVFASTGSVRDYLVSGKGRLRVRGDSQVEVGEDGRSDLVLRSVPYGVNKETLMEALIRVIQAKRVEGIRDLRDESDREGVRIVLPLRRGARPAEILARLCKITPLESTFGVQGYVIHEGKPARMGVAGMIRHWFDHRAAFVRARLDLELRNLEEEAHKLEGLSKAAARIEEVIRWIRESEDQPEARTRLMRELGATGAQADAILAIRLATLTRVDQVEVERKLEDARRRIAEIRTILASEATIRSMVADEASESLRALEVPRESSLLGTQEAASEALSQAAVPTTRLEVGPEGRLREAPQGAGHVVGSDQRIVVLTSGGTAERIDATGATRSTTGHPAVGFVSEGDLPPEILFVTRHGSGKRLQGEELLRFRGDSTDVMGLKDGDHVVAALPYDGKKSLVVATAGGQVLQTNPEEISQQGRSAGGVRVIRLRDGDEVVAAFLSRGHDLGLITSLGWTKAVPMDEVPEKGRGSLGVQAWRDMGRVGSIVYAGPAGDVLVRTGDGEVLFRASEWAPGTRAQLGEKSDALAGAESGVVRGLPAGP